MNNDKRMILAIAMYAAVMTMILHSLAAEGHAKALDQISAVNEIQAEPACIPDDNTELLLRSEDANRTGELAKKDIVSDPSKRNTQIKNHNPSRSGEKIANL